ncbi:hypothetical protein [Dysgonomonas sp. 511]|uniref:hypothetical protein n=1 Tax=Dysgonomonas sp. 511 TaxID=2302930 RepID=UPI0013D126A4|nr:hypothetical protein [Dysgonomonas sp. 511]
MDSKCLVTVYTSDGDKVSGIYIGSPDDFRRTFYQYKLHPRSREYGINLYNRNGGFVRIPMDVMNYSLISVDPIEEVRTPTE